MNWRLRKLQMFGLSALMVTGLLALSACKELKGQAASATPEEKEPIPVEGRIDFGDSSLQPPPVPTPVDEDPEQALKQEFIDIAKDLARRFVERNYMTLPLPPDIQKYYYAAELEDLVGELEIDFVSEILKKEIDGAEKEVDALNYPTEKRIQVNIPRWKAMRGLEARERLVLHELFGIAEIEKDTYQASDFALQSLRKLEHPRTIKDICPREDQSGVSYADYCVDEAAWPLFQRIQTVAEVLLEFAQEKAADETEELSKKKLQLKTYVENLQANFGTQKESRCKDISLIGGGNEGAYHTAVCNYEFTLERHEQITKLYRQIKTRFPQLANPRAIPQPDEAEE